MLNDPHRTTHYLEYGHITCGHHRVNQYTTSRDEVTCHSCCRMLGITVLSAEERIRNALDAAVHAGTVDQVVRALLGVLPPIQTQEGRHFLPFGENAEYRAWVIRTRELTGRDWPPVPRVLEVSVLDMPPAVKEAISRNLNEGRRGGAADEG